MPLTVCQRYLNWDIYKYTVLGHIFKARLMKLVSFEDCILFLKKYMKLTVMRQFQRAEWIAFYSGNIYIYVCKNRVDSSVFEILKSDPLQLCTDKFYSNLSIYPLVSLFKGMSTFVGYFKAILLEEQLWYYLTYSWGRIRELITFLLGISPKVNAIVLLQFELAYYDLTVQHVSPCAMRTLLLLLLLLLLLSIYQSIYLSIYLNLHISIYSWFGFFV